METTGLIITKAKITLLTTEEGGRNSGFYRGYRPNHVFELSLNKYGAHPGDIQFDEPEQILPGETKVVTVRFMKTPAIEKYMQVGQKWYINEANKTIGFGEILDIER